MLEVEAAYIAGLVDGEGTVTINRCAQYRKSRRSKKICLKTFVYITNTDIKMMDFVKRTTGIGRVMVWNKNPKWKIVYSWRVHNRVHISRLLEEVMPFLITKRPQAVRVMEFIRLRAGHAKRNDAYTADEIKIAFEVAGLNKH